MKENGPGDLGAGGVESVLASPGGLGGVMGPATWPLLGKEALPGDSDRLNVATICNMHAEFVHENHCGSVVLLLCTESHSQVCMTLLAFSGVGLLCLWPFEPLLTQDVIIRSVNSI